MRFTAMRLLLLIAAAGALSFPSTLVAQGAAKTQLKGNSIAPCCGVVAIDLRTTVVTARETASGYTFTFKVSDKKLLTALKLGDKVWADFTRKTVRLHKADARPCCNIITTTPEPYA